MMNNCPVCHARVPVDSGPGRPRTYCSAGCWRKAARLRDAHRRAIGALVEVRAAQGDQAAAELLATAETRKGTR